MRFLTEMTMNIGDSVRIIEGASDWMKSRNYWLEDMPDSIDGMNATVIADYTDLPGDDCHYGLDLGYGGMVGVNPMWLIPAA